MDIKGAIAKAEAVAIDLEHEIAAEAKKLWEAFMGELRRIETAIDAPAEEATDTQQEAATVDTQQEVTTDTPQEAATDTPAVQGS